MARFSVQMTFGVPAAPAGCRVPARPGFHALVGDGRMAVTASVRAGSPAAAASEVAQRAARLWGRHGRGPIQLLAWTATEDRVLLGRRRRSSGGEHGDEGGTAGVREPRRPRPSPGSLGASRPVPDSPPLP